MAHNLALLALYLALSSMVMMVRGDCQKTHVEDLREYRVVAVHGRFPVDRKSLQEVLDEFNRNSLPEKDVPFTVPNSLPHTGEYDQKILGEIVLADINIVETYFDEVSNKTLKDVHRSLLLTIPFQSGNTHGVVILADVTDSNSTLTSPMVANRDIRRKVDSVVVSWEPEQTVTYRSGESVFQYTAEYDALCDAEGQVGEDYNGVIGDPILSLPNRGRFDWGCNERNHSFCQYLADHREALDDAGGDVCVAQMASDSRRCPAKVKITEMTGVFRDIAPYLADTVPAESIESEFLDRGHSAGIIYPCLC